MKKSLIAFALVFAGIAAEAESLPEPKWFTTAQIDKMTRVELKKNLIKMQNQAKDAHAVIEKAEEMRDAASKASTKDNERINTLESQNARLKDRIDSERNAFNALRDYLFAICMKKGVMPSELIENLRQDYMKYAIKARTGAGK